LVSHREHRERRDPGKAVLCVLRALCENIKGSSDPAFSAESPLEIRVPSLNSHGKE